MFCSLNYSGLLVGFEHSCILLSLCHQYLIWMRCVLLKFYVVCFVRSFFWGHRVNEVWMLQNPFVCLQLSQEALKRQPLKKCAFLVSGTQGSQEAALLAVDFVGQCWVRQAHGAKTLRSLSSDHLNVWIGRSLAPQPCGIMCRNKNAIWMPKEVVDFQQPTLQLVRTAEDRHQAVGTSAMATHRRVTERRGWPDGGPGSDGCLGLAMFLLGYFKFLSTDCLVCYVSLWNVTCCV